MTNVQLKSGLNNTNNDLQRLRQPVRSIVKIFKKFVTF